VITKEQPVYITGAGIISAIGNNKTEVLQSLRDKRSGIGAMRYLQSIHTELPVGEVKMTDEEMRQLLRLPTDAPANRTSLMGMIAMGEALQEADIDTRQSSLTFISGTTVGGMDYTERHFLEIQENDKNLRVLATHDCGATTLLQACHYGIDKERVITISTACSSAANAIIVGCDLIKAGKADVVLAGGSEAITKFHLNGFNSLMILDHEQCRPFDALRHGLNLGEGAAYVVLESAESMKHRGIRPIGMIIGYGNACDAYHQTASSPNGEGAYRAMKNAIAMAGIEPTKIQYINAHGTGTPNNDVSESAALKRVFGNTIPQVSSTKSFTGHTTSASGAIEAIICLLALNHSFIPGNLGWRNPMPDGIIPTLGNNNICLNYVMCNSFGFGGNDSSLLMARYDGQPLLTHRHELRKVYLNAECRHTPDDPKINIREFVPAGESRRMCALLKSAIGTSLTALKEASINVPDGIFIGTKFGMLANTEKFLQTLCQDGESSFGPTLFMQSTHNTIAGVLGVQTRSHGYNITFSQGDKSLQTATCNAALQIALGRINTALVGSHDESTPIFNALFKRLRDDDVAVGEYSVSLVLTSNPKGAIKEFTDF